MGFLYKLINLPVALRIRFWTWVNPFTFKSKGIRIGGNAIIPGRVHISGSGNITIGSRLYFSSGNGVNPVCGNIHGTLHVDNGGMLVIGDDVGMSSTRIWVHQSVIIGSHVNIGGGAFITDTDAHPIPWEKRREGNEGTVSAPVVIEDDVWIGAQVIVLKGVTIGARSVIGAGSVVTHSIPQDSLAVGNPCRVVRCLNTEP